MQKVLFLFFLLFSFSIGQLQAQCDEAIEVNISTQDACEGETGSASLNVTGGLPPYSLNGIGSFISDTTLQDLAIGIYNLELIDAENCVKAIEFSIKEATPIQIESINIQNASDSCLGGFDIAMKGAGAFIFEIDGRDPINTEGTASIEDLVAGSYIISITDANSCSIEATVIVEEIPALMINVINISPATENCGTTGGAIEIEVEGGSLPYLINWSNGDVPLSIQDLSPGTYIVTISDATGCTIEQRFEVASEGDGCLSHSLFGEVILDINSNCTKEEGELFLPNFPIIFELVKDSTLDSDKIRLNLNALDYTEGIRYQQINTNTNYEIQLELEQPRVSDYAYLKLSLENDPACSAQYFLVEDLMLELGVHEFTLFSTMRSECPAMAVDIGAPFLRRCFASTYYVQYCNYGQIATDGAYVEIQFDEYLDFESSTLAADFLGNNTYSFFIGQVGAGDCGRFSIDIAVDCESELGQTHCTEAHIYPDTPCTIPSNWSGAELRVEADCEGEEVVLNISNIGSGDMPDAFSAVVTEDIILIAKDTFQLAGGTNKELRFPANGATYRIEVPQAMGFPFASQPSVSLEGCGTNSNGTFSKGIINLFPQGDYEPYLSIDCQANKGSFDPNDKRGLPFGIEANHLIEPNTDLEYQIRFQNTGTDTAFNVVILDTLDVGLDWSSIQFGASSHAYEIDKIGDNILRFHFQNILLPDSTTNEVASHGFVNFRIAPRENIELGTIIENRAAIYFDYNEAIITNTTLHTIGMNFLLSKTEHPLVTDAQIQIVPNPFNDFTSLTITGIADMPLQFTLYDVIGRQVHHTTITNNRLLLRRGELAEGLYVFQISHHNQLVATGKLLIRR